MLLPSCVEKREGKKAAVNLICVAIVTGQAVTCSGTQCDRPTMCSLSGLADRPATESLSFAACAGSERGWCTDRCSESTGEFIDSAGAALIAVARPRGSPPPTCTPSRADAAVRRAGNASDASSVSGGSADRWRGKQGTHLEGRIINSFLGFAHSQEQEQSAKLTSRLEVVAPVKQEDP